MVSLVLVAATACSNDCPTVVLDDCIESAVSLQQGVYGRVVSQQDVRIDDCPGQLRPWPQNPITLYPVGSDMPVAEDISDNDGIYELPAAAGDYKVCRSSGTCSDVTVPVNGRVRVDVALPFAMFTVREPAVCDAPLPDAACTVGEWCGNDCDPSSDACWACGELRYDTDCNCRPVASTCFRPDCTAAGLGGSGDYCGTYWWCDRACGDGLQCLDKPDRPVATYLRTCQAP